MKKSYPLKRRSKGQGLASLSLSASCPHWWKSCRQNDRALQREVEDALQNIRAEWSGI